MIILITGWSRRGAVSSTKLETLQNAPNSLRPSNELAFTAAPIAIHHFVFYSGQPPLLLLPKHLTVKKENVTN